MLRLLRVAHTGGDEHAWLTERCAAHATAQAQRRSKEDVAQAAHAPRNNARIGGRSQCHKSDGENIERHITHAEWQRERRAHEKPEADRHGGREAECKHRHAKVWPDHEATVAAK